MTLESIYNRYCKLETGEPLPKSSFEALINREGNSPLLDIQLTQAIPIKNITLKREVIKALTHWAIISGMLPFSYLQGDNDLRQDVSARR